MSAAEGKRPVAQRVMDVVDELVAALVNSRIYWSEHRRVGEAIKNLRAHLQNLRPEVEGDTLNLGVARNFLVYQQRPLVGASIAAARLVQAVAAWGAGGVSLAWDVEEASVRALLELLARKPEPGQTFEHGNQRLAAAAGTRLLPPFVDSDADQSEALRKLAMIDAPVHLYQTIVDMLQEITISVCHGGLIRFDVVHEHASEILQRLVVDESPLMSLARQEQYDAFTFGHSVRVSVLALNFARTLTTDHDLMQRIGVAALLHDVGKSLIPFELLHARRGLTVEEREAMSRHAPLGAQVLLDHDEADPMSIAAAFGHHRTIDGRGYPATLHEHDPSLITRVIKICDAYEALTATRPYKKPMSPIRAYRTMLGMGAQFDAALLRRFVEVNGIYPSGQHVQLGSGEVASVVRQSQELLQPVVRLVRDRDGNPLQPEDQVLIDLSEPGIERRIQGVVGIEQHKLAPA
jgi:HD-GYP domain-containing protein (c-di-GMP phosphodiesterase class II)